MFSELQTLAGAPGFEPGPAVLETDTLPLNYAPIFRYKKIRTFKTAYQVYHTNHIEVKPSTD